MENYEVFLSYRGDDTCHGFTDHLYHRLADRGIMVFRDHEELHVGEKIDQLFEAIKTSKISIPIISPNYASSIWCLKELLQILECKKILGQLVLPVFYNIKPSDVREQKGNFGKKFRLCKKKHGIDGKFLQELEDAFTEVATLKGWELDKIAGGHEGELVKEVVTTIFNELRKAALVVPDFLVGVENHVKEIKKMIDASQSNNAKIIGIHGKGGIGKTTLAKALYNALSSDFECHSFVPDIRESSKSKGMEALQKQIVSDILVDKSLQEISHFDKGITIIEKRFKGKRLLLLLDDVENKEQLNELVVKNSWFGLESIVIITTRDKDVAMASVVTLSYELNELNYDQSYELFCKHAFGKDASCPRNLETIAGDIISMTKGLPLAIEVIGSLLWRADIYMWKETLEKLRRIPNENVHNKLKISYDFLGLEQQQIFLDFACLPIEDKPEIAFDMWKSCGFYPEGIERLISLSLIKSEVRSQRIIMHNQLRDLGREIVLKKGRDNIGLCSRIWLQEEATKAIGGKQGNPKVRALVLQPPYDIHSISQQFENMANLWYLRMNEGHLTGDFKHLFPNLKWFEWFSTWRNISDIMGINFNPKKLVVLNLSRSNITAYWQGWSQLKYLKVLKLDRCPYLRTTPNFSVLNQLEALTLNYCCELRKIHPSIGKLSKKLAVLDVKYCDNLEELPIEVGKMEVLRHLDISYTPIREIPIFEGHMTKLERLLATSCVQLLHISDSLGSLVKLQHLDLRKCKSLTEIPVPIRNLRFLIKLDLRKIGIKDLPNSIGALCSLEQLLMSKTPIKCLPSSIGVLRKLQKLDLEDCKELESLSNLPSSLTSLCFSGDSMEALPNFSNLTNLNHLTYRDLFKRRNRALNLGNLNHLKTLWIQCSDTWDYDLEEKIRISNPIEEINMAPENFNLLLELPGSLHELCISGCVTLHALPNLSNLKNLYKLYLQGCSELMQINGLEGVESLEILVIERCQKLLKLGDLSHLKMLTVLSLCGCEKLSNVQGIEKLTSLTVLSYSGCHFDINFPNLSMLRNLKELKVNHEGIMEIPGLQELKSLEVLKISGCKSLHCLPNLSDLKNLSMFCLKDCSGLMEINGLEGAESLTHLKLKRCRKLSRLDSLSQLNMLNRLCLWDCKNLSDFQCIEKLTSLTDLSLSIHHPEIKFPDLSMLSNLKELEVHHVGVMEIPGLEGLKSLKVLKIFECKSLQYLPDFSQLTNLENLNVQGCEKITEIQGLENLISLRSLNLRGYKALRVLPDLPEVCIISDPPEKEESKMNPDPLNVEEGNESDSYAFESKEERKSDTHTDTRGLENLTSLREVDMGGRTSARKLPTKKFMQCLHQKMEILGIKISEMDGDGMQVNDSGNIFMPIFSERFVSDATCLFMLEHMVERWRKSTNTHVLPIFLAVEPSDVRLQTSLFKESLSELHEKFKDDKLVNQWKDALIEVANIRGWFIPEIYTSEEIDKQANSVCQMVLQKLKWIQLSMGNHLVGIDHDVDRILNLLDLEVNDVQAVWIWGQDGVGKTTLARAVYRRLCSGFEASCFIEEIDERARHSKVGIQFLQAKMVSDLLNREMEVMEDITEGINLISERFCHMKVLIVLDDITVDSLKALAGHLYWFGPGSRIIITARQECFMKVTPPAHSYKISYDLPGEHENTLVQHFCVHAFRRTDPPEDFDSLSREFVKILDPCRGLPLSIEILGSFLHAKSVAEWTSELQSLKEEYSQNHVDTAKIISMSYDSLNEMQKQIFLDISCFPHGIDSRIVSSFCHGSLQSPSVNDFEVLILLSLVKIDGNKRIWMHRLVRDFGRKIVDSINRQGEKQGKEDVEGSDSHTSSELTLPDIKFLRLYEENIYGEFDRDRDFARQRGLIRQRCSSESHLCFENVVVLDFSWCKNWTGCRQIKGSKLRVLNLTGCARLLETPDLSLCQNLEMLVLERCSRLVKIDPSIQHLQHLATLNLKHCTELNELPNEVGHLKALKELHLDGTSIQEIPVSIGNLKNLQILTASNCSSLDHLPQSTCDLSFITELILDFTNITELPCSIWEGMKLENLSLRDCRCIESLPPFDGDVESSLKELDVSGTGISELPLSIVKLKKLRVLKVDFSFISEFPPDLGELKNLEEIHASWCRNLKVLPEDIGKLESLRVFKVGHSSISSLPKSIQLLTRLETLDCTSCNKLQSLPELPSSLKSLHVQLTEPKTLPDLVNLKRLRELTIESSSLRSFSLNLTQLQDLPILPDSLRKLSLCCTVLEHMPRLPSKLVVLSLQDCQLLTELPTMKPLQNLLEMEILHCSKIGEIEGLGNLKALRILKISDCRIKSLQELGELTSLTKLTLHDCQLLGNLCVTNLQNLMELEILRCPKIEKIEGVQGLRELRSQTVLGCGVKMEKIRKNLRS